MIIILIVIRQIEQPRERKHLKGSSRRKRKRLPRWGERETRLGRNLTKKERRTKRFNAKMLCCKEKWKGIVNVLIHCFHPLYQACIYQCIIKAFINGILPLNYLFFSLSSCIIKIQLGTILEELLTDLMVFYLNLSPRCTSDNGQLRL